MVFKDKNFSGLIGVSALEVSPKDGIYMRNWGAAKQNHAEGNHSHLMLHCISFQKNTDDVPMIMITADFGLWRSSELKNEILNLLADQFKLPQENLIICFSHTHSAPILSKHLPDDSYNKLQIEYIDDLILKLIQLINNCLENVQNSIITWKYGECTLATNRDLYLPNNNQYVTGFNPEKKADNTLVVGRITDSNSNLTRAIIVNYACHPTTLAWENKLISPDYIGPMREKIQMEYNCPILFIQGSSGELAPQRQYTDDLSMVQKNGYQLAYDVLSVMESMLNPKEEMYLKEVVVSGADLALWKFRKTNLSRNLKARMISVSFNLKPFPKLEEIEDLIRSETDHVKKEKLYRLKNNRVQFGDAETTRIPVWIWEIGEGLIVAQQNETYSYFQRELRSSLNEKCVMVGNLTNGSAGYLPPKDLYDKNCYTVNQTPFAAGSLELLTKKCIDYLTN